VNPETGGRKKNPLLLRLFVFITAAVLIIGICAMSGRPGVERLVENGGFILVKDGRIARAINPEGKFIPASIAKIATALAAIDTLGADYRFPTSFYLGPDNQLYIKSGGDPFLVSEEIRLIADELKEAGVKKITAINLDQSIFIPPGRTPWNGGTLNPYDAVNAGLAVNFNTVFIKRDTGGIRSAEEQTPTIPLMTELGRSLLPGKAERINITAAFPALSCQYTAQLFAAILNEQGIKTSDRWRISPPPAGLAPILVHRSSLTLKEVVQAMLLYSNNFIANQLFLVMGAHATKTGGDWENGRRFLRAYLDKKGISREEIDLFEGSGLSRKNRVSCRGMIHLLELFSPHAALLPIKDGALVKSGTMTGIYAYAGYIPTDGTLNPFVIILNQKENNRDPILSYFRDISTTEPPGP